ncbi:MAG: hypothetical protein OK452_09060 [Thaumarchaeota archaeon]|nr:hypothetical protein [Nitrososphaerota archaeon]
MESERNPGKRKAGRDERLVKILEIVRRLRGATSKQIKDELKKAGERFEVGPRDRKFDYDVKLLVGLKIGLKYDEKKREYYWVDREPVFRTVEDRELAVEHAQDVMRIGRHKKQLERWLASKASGPKTEKTSELGPRDVEQHLRELLFMGLMYNLWEPSYSTEDEYSSLGGFFLAQHVRSALGYPDFLDDFDELSKLIQNGASVIFVHLLQCASHPETSPVTPPGYSDLAEYRKVLAEERSTHVREMGERDYNQAAKLVKRMFDAFSGMYFSVKLGSPLRGLCDGCPGPLKQQ